jgi:hypothetical protein
MAGSFYTANIIDFMQNEKAREKFKGALKIYGSLLTSGIVPDLIEDEKIVWAPETALNAENMFALETLMISKEPKNIIYSTIYNAYFKQISKDKDAIDTLKRLCRIMDNNIDVLYLCICSGNRVCHRSFLAKWMRSKNYKVIEYP